MIKKTTPPSGDGIRKSEVDEPLRFSFRHFNNHSDFSPKEHPEHYTQKLMERLRDLSTSWTLKRFTSQFERELRNHVIDWAKTARKEGFREVLPTALRDSEPWQFSITKREHGRVIGFLIGGTFYVVWLDCNHALYP